MRWGCCAGMISPQSDPIGIESVERLAAMGFDYVELSLAHVTLGRKNRIGGLADRIARTGLRCEACNNFFPPQVRLTGPEADLNAAVNYAARAMDHAARLGAQVIVFGSSGAKNVPAGFPRAKARRQVVALLERLGPMTERYGLTIAIEPISRPEANFINRASEGLALAREVNHPNIQLLIDYYHLARESEDPDIIREAAGAVRHVHFARPEGRAYPDRWERSYGPFFDALGAAGYRGRCSIEAYTGDFAAEAPRALALLRKATTSIER